MGTVAKPTPDAIAQLEQEIDSAISSEDMHSYRGSVQTYLDKALQKQAAGADYLPLTAIVHCHEQTFVINVGNGSQTVKWLALNAQKRYSNHCKANGRQRQRDVPGGRFSGSFIPVNVEENDTASQTMVMVHPRRKLQELTIVDDTIEVTVTLQREQPNRGRLGKVERSLWSDLAFSPSTGEKRYEAYIEEKRQRLVEVVEETRSRKAEEIQALMHARVWQGSKIAAAFERDWSQMKVESIVSEEAQWSIIKGLLLQHFVPLRDAFKYYSGIGGGGDDQCSMSFMEFSHFVHEAKVCNVIQDHALLEQIQSETNLERDSDPTNPDLDFVRFEFLEALLRLALKKFGGLEEVLRTEPKQFRRIAASECVIRLLDIVVPHAEKKTSGPIRAALQSQDVQLLFHENIEDIKAIYNTYCTVDQHDEQQLERGMGSMNLAEFTALMIDHGLLGGSGQNKTLTKQEARSAFAAAQQEDESEAYLDQESGEQLSELIFPEFIEALVRITLAKWEDEAVPVAEKLQLAIQALLAGPISSAKKQRTGGGSSGGRVGGSTANRQGQSGRAAQQRRRK